MYNKSIIWGENHGGWRNILNVPNNIELLSITGFLQKIEFARASGLEACVVTCFPKNLLFDFFISLRDPSAANRTPHFKDPEHIFDHWALHGPILFDCLTETVLN